jgi:hypothetical protein
MSTEVAVIVLATAWLVALTFTMLLVVRHIGILALRLQTAHEIAPDGLMVGEAIPGSVIDRQPELDRELRYLVFLAANCGPCQAIAPRLGEVSGAERVLALVLGEHDQAEDGITQMIPLEISRLAGSDAGVIAEALLVQRTPQALQVENGIITGKALLRDTEDLERLMGAYETSDAKEIAATAREAIENGAA